MDDVRLGNLHKTLIIFGTLCILVSAITDLPRILDYLIVAGAIGAAIASFITGLLFRRRQSRAKIQYTETWPEIRAREARNRESKDR